MRNFLGCAASNVEIDLNYLLREIAVDLPLAHLVTFAVLCIAVVTFGVVV